MATNEETLAPVTLILPVLSGFYRNPPKGMIGISGSTIAFFDGTNWIDAS